MVINSLVFLRHPCSTMPGVSLFLNLRVINYHKTRRLGKNPGMVGIKEYIRRTREKNVKNMAKMTSKKRESRLSLSISRRMASEWKRCPRRKYMEKKVISVDQSIENMRPSVEQKNVQHKTDALELLIFVFQLALKLITTSASTIQRRSQ